MLFLWTINLACFAILCVHNLAEATRGQGLQIIARFRQPCPNDKCTRGAEWDEIDTYVQMAKEGGVPMMVNINHEWKIVNEWSEASKKYLSDKVASYVANGAIVTAYVSTDYGSEDPDDVEGNVYEWLEADFGYDRPCPISGIFFDEAPADPKDELLNLYTRYSDHTRAIKSDAFIFFNAGGTWSSSYPYQQITNAYCVREKASKDFIEDWPSQVADWIKENDLDGFYDDKSGTDMGQTAIIIYKAGTEEEDSWQRVFEIGQENHVKWVSTTTDYEKLPSWHGDIIKYLCNHTYGSDCKLQRDE